MPGGSTRLRARRAGLGHGRPPAGSFFGEVVFCLRRPAQIYEWGHPREDGTVEIVGSLKRWPDTSGEVRSWLTVHCYFEIIDCAPYTKRYAPDDLESYREDLANLPSIVLIETMEARGFHLE